MKNYTFIESKYIDEIESKVSVYRHNKSGARICTMENEDENKVFSIAFRTPAINNCGLTHILEHSVLCGSKKYPVKDPFVELLKSSLNTFLNAFTFPDKTMYPVASLNLKDFKNLMSVYMDAVFYPNIYEHEEIFRQEGWHYHILDKNDPITYNGVVYNEMRGAFSDPQSILQRQIMHSLYKDTAYGLESGGDPKYIPDLDYKEFLKFHSEYYSPSNSYIYIYGDCDMEERLDWLDKEYLSKFDKIDFDTTIKYQPKFDKPVYDTSYYQTEGELKDKTFLSYNISLPSILDIKTVEAVSIIVDALFNIPGAKLKEKLQKEGIATDIDAYFEIEILEPFISITATGSNPDDEDKFIKIIDEEFENILKNGLDKETILSLINHAEFENRERSFSSRMPKGLLIIMAALTSYLYDDNCPFSALETIEYFKEFKEDINNNYFENLIKDIFVNNKHKSFVKLVPTLDSMSKEDELISKKLKEYKDSLTDEELDNLILMNKKLIDYQNEESSEDDINKLPKLTLDDLDIKPENYKFELK
ncbi:MAG: insulinase family protein [Acholeplasmatales bacterium]|nr:insulinase family protein [Acholeplasmatales bacterium]